MNNAFSDSNASLVSLVVEQLVIDNLVVVKTDGKLTRRSAEALGAAATSLAIVMQKDRVKMFRYIRFWALRKAKATAEVEAWAKALATKHDILVA